MLKLVYVLTLSGLLIHILSPITVIFFGGVGGGGMGGYHEGTVCYIECLLLLRQMTYTKICIHFLMNS